MAPGYRLEVDSVGYNLPTAIAVIPEPFTGDEAPIYFVAELQGTIKVVTRDRTVHDFAAVPTRGGQGPDLDGNSQQGLAGLCMAPDHGYLFATFTEPDDGGVLRNRIVRFTAPARGYAIGPTVVEIIAPEVAEFQSAPAHQIGSCVVNDERLFVGVGDGGNPKVAADPSVLLGKVLCLTLDGRPCAEAPFGDGGPAAFVYASGFRNPFALAWHGSNLYVAGNGVDIDRFVAVSAGRDHLWNGTDEALAAAAEVVFPNPFSPVNLVYVPADATYMDPDWTGRFVASGFGSRRVASGVVTFGGKPAPGRYATTPSYLIQNVGPQGSQHFAGVATGNDGLYVVPMLPVGAETGAVLRLTYDPENAHAPVVAKGTELFRGPGLETLNDLGCTGCHAIAGTGGGIGPNLDRFGLQWRITEYLNSAAYEGELNALLDTGEEELDVARRAVLRADGLERTWVWMKELLLNPRFDDPERSMPDLGLTVDEAEAARDELFTALGLSREPITLANYAARIRDNLRPLLAGAFAGAALVLLAKMTFEQTRRRRRRRASRQPIARRRRRQDDD